MHTYVALEDLRKASESRFHSIILSPLRNIDTLGWLLLRRDYQCINQRWDINEFNWNIKASILFSELYIQNIYSLLISNHSFADIHKDVEIKTRSSFTVSKMSEFWFFWCVFSRTRTEYVKFQHSVWLREKRTKKMSRSRHSSHNAFSRRLAIDDIVTSK